MLPLGLLLSGLALILVAAVLIAGLPGFLAAAGGALVLLAFAATD